MAGSGQRIQGSTTRLRRLARSVTTAAAHDRLFGIALPAVTPSNATAYPVALPAKGATWILLQ